MVERNLKWRAPELVVPRDVDLETLVQDYGESAKWVDGVTAIWVVASGPMLEIYTVIDGDRTTERQLHGLENKLLFGKLEPFVQFHITRSKNLQEQFAALEPAYI